MHLEQNKRRITAVLLHGPFGTNVTLAYKHGPIFYKMTRITKPFVSIMGPKGQKGPYKKTPMGLSMVTYTNRITMRFNRCLHHLTVMSCIRKPKKVEEHKGRCHAGNFAHVVSIADAAVFGRSLSHFLLHKKPVLTVHTVRFRISRNTIRNCSSILLCAGRSPFSSKRKTTNHRNNCLFYAKPYPNLCHIQTVYSHSFFIIFLF